MFVERILHSLCQLYSHERCCLPMHNIQKMLAVQPALPYEEASALQ